MKHRLWRNLRSFIYGGLFAVPFVLAGCGGGGSGSTSTAATGTGTALQVGEKVSVVDAKGSSSSSSISGLRIGNIRLSAVGDLPSASDYHTDKAHTFVQDRTVDVLSMVNEILCSMSQTQYDEMINKGDYKAQIDVGQCNKSGDDASSAGAGSMNQSSGSSRTKYEYWTVNSARADDSSPHIVKVWIHMAGDDHGADMIVQAKTAITESASTSNPYGIFSMNFKATAPNSDTIMMKGYLKAERDSATNEVLLKFYNNGDFGGGMSFTEQITLNRSNDGSSGTGSIAKSGTEGGGGGASTAASSTIGFDIAYNSTHFLRRDASSNEVCMARANPDVTVLRYGLYNDENHSSPGSRKTVNSGFPVRYNDGSQDYYGWIGFWGAWFPGSVSISDGATVYKMDYSSSGTTETPYNIVVKNGKLKKHTKNLLTLDDIKNLPLDYWTDSGNFQVKWDGSNFVKFAKLDQTQFVWQDITDVNIDLTTLQFTDLNFWSMALGGQVRILLESASNPCTFNQNNNTFDCSGFTKTGNIVVFFAESTVTPDTASVPSTFYCLSQCPDPSAMSGVSSGGSPFFTTSDFQSTPPSSATYINYSFNTSGSNPMLLTSSGTPVVMSGTVSSGNYQWGVMSGPLFTQNDLSSLACDFNSNNTCGWQAWSDLDVFYTWETGPNDWNKLTLLQSPGDSSYLSFEAPLHVAYTHTQTDSSAPDAKYNGTTFYLEYNGFGDLHGIPGKCVDMDTGADTDCFQEAGGNKMIRWVNEFNIPDGSTVTHTSSGTTTTYYVKALEKEERMNAAQAGVSDCTASGLSLISYTLPDSSLWEDPNLGTEPTVTDAPAVIGGIVQ